LCTTLSLPTYLLEHNSLLILCPFPECSEIWNFNFSNFKSTLLYKLSPISFLLMTYPFLKHPLNAPFKILYLHILIYLDRISKDEPKIALSYHKLYLLQLLLLLRMKQTLLFLSYLSFFPYYIQNNLYILHSSIY